LLSHFLKIVLVSIKTGTGMNVKGVKMKKIKQLQFIMLKQIFLYYVYGEIRSHRLNNFFVRIWEISPPVFAP